MRGTRAAAVAAGLCLLVASPASAAPGGPDGRFGKGGFVHASFGEWDGGYGIARTADGRVVVAGGALGGRGPGAFFLARYLTNGRPDTSFGSRGVVRTSFGGDLALATRVEQLADGRLLAVGLYDGQVPGVAMARYTASGRPDGTFGKGGKAIGRTPGQFAIPAGLAVAGDGSFVVTGTTLDMRTMTASPFVARFLANGAADTSFGTNGLATLALAGAEGSANAPVIQPDGTVVVAGTVMSPQAGTVPFVVRLLPNGLQDPTFGSPGMTTLAGGGFNDLLRTPEGLLVAGGSRPERGTDGGDRVATVVRLLPTGTLDPTFGTGGVATAHAGPQSVVFALGLLADGRIVGAGWGTGREPDLMLLRLTSAGQLDKAFGKGGVSLHGQSGKQDAANDLVVAPDNTVTVTGLSIPSRRPADTLTARFLG
jgi:uncharacterized delta-60 repeat protein